jgi:hypothetical protein
MILAGSVLFFLSSTQEGIRFDTSEPAIRVD